MRLCGSFCSWRWQVGALGNGDEMGWRLGR
jgi:hypothetical protein